MSIFGSIMTKIFHRGATPAVVADASAPGAAPAAPTSTTAASAPAAGAPTASAAAPVDVAAVLTEMASHAGQTLDWRHSIVDLMKLLGLDSSLAARKELAGELHYSGDTGDSATMNVWLHKQVMIKLAENGGKVPDELKH
jgi:hypothetical protein